MRLIKDHWQLGLITLIIFLLWNHPVSAPVKIFVVFLHELSHALATWLTGGKVLELTLSARQGGSVLSQGGNGFLIASTGYLGSLLLGSALFFIRTPFTIAFCLAGGVAFLVSSKFLPREFNDFCLRLIGLTSLVYVPFDIFSDTVQRSYLRSDARIIAETYGGSTLFWGGLWLLVSFIFIYAVLRLGLRKPSNIQADIKAGETPNL
jgi:hypothetical protein